MHLNHLLLQEKYVTITIVELLLATWHLYFTEILEEKHLRFIDYLNQIYGSLAALKTLQHFPAAKATCLKELAECFRPRNSPDAPNREFAKTGSCIQIQDTAP